MSLRRTAAVPHPGGAMTTAAERPNSVDSAAPSVKTASPELVPIAVATLRPMTRLGIDLFLRPEDDAPPVLYRASDYQFEADDADRLMASGVRALYIESAALPRYQRYLRANFSALVSDQRVEPQGRFTILQETAGALLDEAFRAVKVERAVEVAGQVGKHIVGLLADDTMVPAHLFDVMRHDYYTYIHVVNVATYAVMLASDLGVSDEDELQKIAIGAMLHDIGKRHVASALVRKGGALSAAERELMRRHPQTGFVELRREANLEWPQLMMVYQHHEQVDGGGYPVGVPQDEIDWHARLCSVVDVFDAMTCNRPYRRRMPVPNVLGYLHANAGVIFDAEMVKCWISAFRN